MELTVTGKVVYNKFPAMSAGIEAKALQIVSKAASDLEAGAKERARVDTGAMKNSIQQTPTGAALQKTVFIGIDYGVHHEFGTVHIPAQPMIRPAADKVRPAFVAACKRLFEV